MDCGRKKVDLHSQGVRVGLIGLRGPSFWGSVNRWEGSVMLGVLRLGVRLVQGSFTPEDPRWPVFGRMGILGYPALTEIFAC